MSGKYRINKYLAGIDFSALTYADKVELLEKILGNKIHGISYSPYIDWQRPGMEVEESQIEERLKIIQPYTKWIRTFSCTEGNQYTPVIGKRLGLKTMVGVCLSDDRENNEIEFANAIKLANDGHVDILAVGNEVLLRGELTEQELISYIERAKKALPDTQVSYVDAYYQFEEHPALTAVCDVLLVYCYPFWEGCHADYALLYMKDMYHRAQKVANGKKVIISETGWPSAGEAYGAAEPSSENAIQYFINTCQWALDEDVDIFYFSSFDEKWKMGDEGDVGAFWGLWDEHGRFKYQ